MKQFSDNKRRIGGLLLEVLVLIFLFGGSWFGTEFSEENKGELVLKASPIEQIAFCDSDSYMKSLLDFISKTQISPGNFIPFIVDFPSLEIANTSCLLSVTHSLYNTFYTHLTAKAP